MESIKASGVFAAATFIVNGLLELNMFYLSWARFF